MKTYRIEKVDQGFKISGLINCETVTHIHKQGMDLLNGCDEVRLDFAEVAHTDSCAIALLLSWLRFANQKKKSLTFINLPGQLLEIANVCEVMPFLEEYISK